MDLRKLGRLALTSAFLIAGLAVSPRPAHADPVWYPVRYQNVGNPGWCMEADPVTGPHLMRCDPADSEQQWWWSFGEGMQYQGLVRLKRSGNLCLTVRPLPYGNPRVDTGCNENDPDQYWDVWGQNGWVVYQKAGTMRCLFPSGTGTVAFSYPLAMDNCPLRNNVPNIFAWRY